MLLLACTKGGKYVPAPTAVRLASEVLMDLRLLTTLLMLLP